MFVLRLPLLGLSRHRYAGVPNARSEQVTTHRPEHNHGTGVLRTLPRPARHAAEASSGRYHGNEPRIRRHLTAAREPVSCLVHPGEVEHRSSQRGRREVNVLSFTDWLISLRSVHNHCKNLLFIFMKCNFS